MSPNYDAWSKQDLIARLTDLELRLKASPHRHHPKRSVSPGASGRPFHFKDHPVRKIAVKFCYSGWEYNGLAYQIDPTPLPTVEEVLFQAFAKTRLVDAEAGLEGCGWERCGRTDVGVSAAGQVVSLWVRSALPADSTHPAVEQPEPGAPASDPTAVPDTASDATPDATDQASPDLPSLDLVDEPPSNSSVPPPRTEELRYVSILNRVLPPTVRVLAWSPVSPDFSARYNCTHRHYKYFFTAYGLGIPLMQRAATALVGEHDFRNLSKLDPAKQITDFRRRIIRADIALVSARGHDDDDAMYVLDLVGTAFLYHQVRHIMAVLFLVGAGLESPSIVPTLMNVDGSERPISRTDPPLPIVDRKPEYQMADALSLLLWDCAFADVDVRWQQKKTGNGDDHTREDDADARTRGGLYHQLHSVHQRSLIHTTLEAHFLAATAWYHPPPPKYFPFSATGLTSSTIPLLANKEPPVLSVPLGGGTYRRGVKYVPLVERKRLDHVEVVNARWRDGKGSRRIARADAAYNDTTDNEQSSVPLKISMCSENKLSLVC